MQAKSKEAARYLKERYGVSQVYLFGSLARGRIHGRSDIDIMVLGAPKEHRMRLAAEVDQLVSPFTSHILFGDEVGKRMLRSVMARGVRIE
ncbi:MAG: nucleotidyltransferase domain-containing protein [Firmicutes bacterium]|nr:nucleotidyltransferase domain-containing protein [Bacillota bacterium]